MDAMLWRRLDTPGHDVARLERAGDGWRLAGTAVFLHELGPADVAYELVCDAGWSTRTARVQGRVGPTPIDLRIRRDDAGWTLNGAPVPAVRDCAHLDLGFTPATNLPQLRAMALSVGEARDIRVAWIDVPDAKFESLLQEYRRTSERSYAYASPSVGYAATLEVEALGFVRTYPTLWEAAG